MLERVCRRWSPNGGSSLVRRANSCTPFVGVQETVLLVNRVFVPPKRGGFWRKRRKWRICVLASKTRALLLRPRETTKMTKMAGVPQAKAWFTKSTVFFLFPEFGGSQRFWQMFPRTGISSKKSFPAMLPWQKTAVVLGTKAGPRLHLPKPPF